jgi:hypothetical protein
MSNRKTDAERKKDEEIIEKQRETYLLNQQKEKFEARRATEEAARQYLMSVEKCVEEICRLETAISVRRPDEEEVTWKLQLKEQEVLKEIDRIRNYYTNEKEKAKHRMEKKIGDAKDDYDNQVAHLEKAQKEALSKRQDRVDTLETKKNKVLQHVPITAASKKMTIELQEKIEQYPRLVASWAANQYNGKFPEGQEMPPKDYKQHTFYKKKKGITERAMPVKPLVVPEKPLVVPEKPPAEIPERNQLEIPEKQFKTQPASPPEKLVNSRGALPPPQKSKISETPGQLSSEPLSQISEIPKPLRKKKTVAIAENASGSMFNGINIISSTKRPEVIFTVPVPGKKFLDYTKAERENFSHGDHTLLYNEFLDERDKEREQKEREWKAKLSKEEDEAEAIEIRLKRKAEEAEKEWAALEED